MQVLAAAAALNGRSFPKGARLDVCHILHDGAQITPTDEEERRENCAKGLRQSALRANETLMSERRILNRPLPPVLQSTCFMGKKGAGAGSAACGKCLRRRYSLAGRAGKSSAYASAPGCGYAPKLAQSYPPRMSAPNQESNKIGHTMIRGVYSRSFRSPLSSRCSPFGSQSPSGGTALCSGSRRIFRCETAIETNHWKSDTVRFVSLDFDRSCVPARSRRFVCCVVGTRICRSS